MDARAERADPNQVAYDYQAKRTWAWQRLEHLGQAARKEEVQLAALREFVKRTDPEPTRVSPETGDGDRIVAIQIIFEGQAVNGGPQAPLQTDGRQVHLDLGDGGGA